MFNKNLVVQGRGIHSRFKIDDPIKMFPQIIGNTSKIMFIISNSSSSKLYLDNILNLETITQGQNIMCVSVSVENKMLYFLIRLNLVEHLKFLDDFLSLSEKELML